MAAAQPSEAAPPAAACFQLPEWLNATLFDDVLKQHVPNYGKIRNFKAAPALTAGENYSTVIVRIEIDAVLEDGSAKALSYIMKLPQEHPMFQMMMTFHDIFTIERMMYRDIVPDFEQMYRNAGIEVSFGPKSYDVQTPSEYGAVLVDDLCTRGFKNANRLEGLDMEHMKCALKKLAQWHAASAVRFETKGPYADILVVGVFSEPMKAMMEQINSVSAKYLLQCMKSYDGHEAYYESVVKLQSKLSNEVERMAKPNTNEFNVLNHGDCWANNIMFQYDAFGQIKETLFVDFQMIKYGSPAQDLLHLILSSAKCELKVKCFDHFIKYYHDNLVESLRLLQYAKALPTLKELHMATYKYGIWGYFIVSTAMGGTLADPNDSASTENFLSETDAGSNFKMQMYSNPRYRRHMEIVMPWLHNRGALE